MDSHVASKRLAGEILLIVVVIVLLLGAIGAGISLGTNDSISPNAFAVFSAKFFAAIFAVRSSSALFLYTIIGIALSIGILMEVLSRENNNGLRPAKPSNHLNGRSEIIVLSLTVLMTSALVGYPRTYRVLPIGGDTLFYMSAIQTMHVEGAAWAVKYTDRPLLYLILYGIQSLSGFNIGDFFKILPIALAVILTVNVWLFVRVFWKDAAPYAAMMTGISASLMRSTIDLYSSLFATCLFLVCLTIYTSHKESHRLRERAIFPALLVLLLLSYWFLWLFLFVVLAVAGFFTSSRYLIMKRLILGFIPSIVAMGLLVIVAIVYPPPIYWGLGSSFGTYLGKSVAPFGVVTSNVAVFSTANLSLATGEGNVLLPILAAAALAFVRPKSHELKIVYTWSAATFVMTLVSTIGSHAALLFPLPLLAGLGLRKIVELV